MAGTASVLFRRTSASAMRFKPAFVVGVWMQRFKKVSASWRLPCFLSNQPTKNSVFPRVRFHIVDAAVDGRQVKRPPIAPGKRIAKDLQDLEHPRRLGTMLGEDVVQQRIALLRIAPFIGQAPLTAKPATSGLSDS